MSFKGADKED